MSLHALIIEDEAIIAMTIEDLLIDLGFTSFDMAVTEAEAVAAAILNCPDLITADVNLLVGSGIDAVQIICRDRAIPVVFITSAVDQVRSRSAASIIVEKPIDTLKFRRNVEAALT